VKFLTAALTILLMSWVQAIAPARADMLVQACFSPEGKCSAYIVREIDQAKQELLVAVYAFTSGELARALIRAKNRGISVRVIIDREFDLGNEKSKGKFLASQRIPVRRIAGVKLTTTDRERGLMHQKFAVIDRRVVFTGSYNWTHAAETLNDENLLLFHDAVPLAEEYRAIFFRLWERKP
jgi:phosphatidylserine/phosphatidylglycerophosphate/cardiolipin synthase-like enzyme